MSFSYACSKTLSPLPAKKAQRAVIGKRNTCVLCETSEMLICHSHRRKGILIHCIFKKVKKKYKINPVSRQREVTMKKQVKYKVPLRGACLLGLTCSRKFWFKCPASAEDMWCCHSCCYSNREGEEISCRKKMLPLPERGAEGKRRRKGRSNHEHQPWLSFSCPSVSWHTAP